METKRGPRRPSADGRARSLDRSQAPKKDAESWNGRFSQTAGRRALRRTASDGAQHSASSSHSADAQGAVAAALPPEEREILPSDWGPPEDTKKDKASRRAQQGWLKTLINFFLLRTALEEPREKTNRKSKRKEEPAEPPEAAEEPSPKKAQDRTTSPKKHRSRKHSAEEPRKAEDLEPARGQERVPPCLGAPSHVAEEVDLGLTCRGGPDSDFPKSLPTEGSRDRPSDSSPQVPSPPLEEEPTKPDREEVIQKIVELLKNLGDKWEEEQVQAPPPEVAPQNTAPPPRRKAQEKKPSFKRAFSKKLAPEESRRAGATSTLSAEPRPPKRPGFLALFVGSQRNSFSSSHGMEEPGVHSAWCTDDEDSRLAELSTPDRCQGPVMELSQDGISESRVFMKKILALLQNAEKLEEEQPQGQEAGTAAANLAPACKRKSPEKKPSFRRAFSHRKHSPKESKRIEAAGALGASSPEARSSRRYSFLPMCVGGHRASVSSSTGPEGAEFQEPLAADGVPTGFSEAPAHAGSHTQDLRPPSEGACASKEAIICKLVALLQEVDGELGKQIRRHPSFKRFFYGFSDASLRKLVATLRRRKGGSVDLGLLNNLVVSHSRVCSLMPSRGHYEGHSYAHFLSREAQQNIMSQDHQSPD